MSAITIQQIRALRTAASKVFGGCDCPGQVCAYHDWLAANFNGIASTTDLDRKQATAAINFLRQKISYQNQKRRTYRGAWHARGSAADRLTHEQAAKIGALAELLGWDARQVRKFILRQTGLLTDVQMLRNYQAVKLIVGMQRVASCGKERIYRFLNTAKAQQWQTRRGQRIRRAIQNRRRHHGTTIKETGRRPA